VVNNSWNTNERLKTFVDTLPATRSYLLVFD